MKSAVDVDWPTGLEYALDGMRVAVSRPALIGRSNDYLWFPNICELPSGELIANAQPYHDLHVPSTRCSVFRSADGGLTWSDPIDYPAFGWVSIQLPNDDHLQLPYYRYAGSDGKTHPYNVIRADTGEIEHFDCGIRVDGWPRPEGMTGDPKMGLLGFSFTGDTVVLEDGRYLCTLYGNFKDDKRDSVVCADSEDGRLWHVRSVIADGRSDLPAAEGPNETAMCRLADGRLAAVIRLGSYLNFAQAFSEDEGLTWSQPEQMNDAWAVQPSLDVLESGAALLSGGRAGIHVWIDAEGTFERRQRIDVRQHHNALIHDQPIAWSDCEDHWTFAGTSCYTELITIGPGSALMVYDRLPNGWDPLPAGEKGEWSVWVVRIDVK